MPYIVNQSSSSLVSSSRARMSAPLIRGEPLESCDLLSTLWWMPYAKYTTMPATLIDALILIFKINMTRTFTKIDFVCDIFNQV